MSSHVTLISYSQSPVHDISASPSPSPSLVHSIAYCARVSNPANQNNTATDERLLQYLIRNKHRSPFEMVSICLEIVTTRDIARQILRHRSFSFQEFSQRYARVETETEPVCREARLQDKTNRQNSIELQPSDADDDNAFVLISEWEHKQQELLAHSHSVYNWALSQGIAKEQARVVLPEGLTETRMYVNGNVRSWIHYLQLRCGNGTQKEHQEVARKCVEAIAPIFPMIRTLVEPA